MSANIANHVVREIEECYRLLENWMAGRAEHATVLHRIESVIDEEFSFVTSSGLEIDRARFLGHLKQLKSQCAETRIWAENIRVICASELFVVARFDEYEQDKSFARSRVQRT